MKNILLLLSIICAVANESLAGKGIISGIVKNDGHGISAATVSLLNAADSSWIRSELSGDDGRFTFNDVSTGNYLISASAVGYAAIKQKTTIGDSGTTEIVIDMQPLDTTLHEVTVTAQKPFIEMSMGKITVNVEHSPTAAGNSALELLRKLPGVMVYQDGIISMHGKQGVLVLLDDRPTYLSDEQLAAYLRTITAEEIAQIELITQPGAKYDAAGNTGVINIKRKRNKKPGLNGNAALSYIQGVYPFVRNSAMLNYKKNKLNLGLNASDMEGKGFAEWTQDQRFTDRNTGITTSTAHIHSAPVERFGIAAVRLSADYDWSESTSVGGSVRGTYHPNDMHGFTTSTRTDASSTPTYNEIDSREGFIRKDVSANAYLSHKFSAKSNIEVNVDHLKYSNAPWQDIDSKSYDQAMHLMPDPLLLRSRQPSLIDVYSAKADHTATIVNNIKLESGIKSSVVSTDNNAMFTVFQNNAWIDDTGRSNHFVYREHINAAYIALAKSFGERWDTRIGMRGEQTIADGVQYIHDDHFIRNYLSLFPTAYINYKVGKDNQFELNYGRRIDRPAYEWLNPFIYYSFQYNYAKGNPYLLPQFTSNIELKHSYKNMLITTLGFSRTTDVITDVLETNSATRVIYNTRRNLASSSSVSLALLFNKELFKWWSLNASAYAAYTEHAGVVGDTFTRRNGVGYIANINTQFNHGKGWKTEGMLYYSSRFITSLIETTGRLPYMEIGISKKVTDTLQVKVSLNDPLYTYKMRLYNDVNELHTDALYRNNSQQIAFALNYSFGKEQSRQHASAIDETQRMKVD